jgi:hypothetical protein
MNRGEYMIPDAALRYGERQSRAAPGRATLYCATSLNSYKSILLLAHLLPGALACEGSFDSFFLSRFQVKGVALDLFDDVLLLHLALKAAQGVLQGFTLLQSNFRQTDTPPNPSGRTD